MSTFLATIAEGTDYIRYRNRGVQISDQMEFHCELEVRAEGASLELRAGMGNASASC